jgi:chaperonin GroES
LTELPRQRLTVRPHNTKKDTWHIADGRLNSSYVAVSTPPWASVAAITIKQEPQAVNPSATRRSNHMSLKPLHDRVLIKRIEEQETVKGGIIIPDTAKEKSQEGEVVALGAGKILENGSVLPLAVKAGDRILFGKYSGAEVRISNQDYLILREDEIIGILTQNGKAAGKK